MLSESFIAASSSPPSTTSANSALLKDAGIFVHSFQPQFSLNSTFKKSAVGPSCLAVNATHVFAAQSNKAVVHVYNRERGNHEFTIHFPQRILSLILVCDDTILALGGEDGSILLWEVCTGRLIVTPLLHLQGVSALAVDLQSNFLLSGSLDSNINVWSLVDLLSFPSMASVTHIEHVHPRQTLHGHQAAITSVITGHSTTSADIAISVSRDQTAVTWNYRSGQRLRTYLLPSTPLCLALDPADRAFYVGFDDGAIQFISFYSNGNASSSINGLEGEAAPIQPPTATIKYATSSASDLAPTLSDGDTANSNGNAAESALCLALSYDSTTLISGHASGKIYSWSTAGSGSFSATLAQYSGCQITNINFLPPQGWLDSPSVSLRTTAITKPATHEVFSGSNGRLAGSYTFTAQQLSPIPSFSAQKFHSGILQKRRPIHVSRQMSRFESTLRSATFPDDIMAASTYEIANWDDRGKQNSKSFAENEDFVSIDVDMDTNGEANKDLETGKTFNPESRDHMAEKIAHLEKHVEHLTGLINVNVKHIDELFHQNERYKLEKERAARHRRKNEVWRTLKRDALRGLPAKSVPKELMESDSDYDHAFDSGATDVEADEEDEEAQGEDQAIRKGGRTIGPEESQAKNGDEEMQEV